MSETLLKVRDLKKSYGDHAVLKGVSYDIEQGKIVGLRPERLRKNLDDKVHCRPDQ